MWPVSGDFAAAVVGSHTIAVRVEVLRAGVTQDVIPIDGGNVEVDVNQTCRRHATIPLIDLDGRYVVANAEDLLNVTGNELRIWKGIDFGDDRPGFPDGIAPAGVELVPLITGPIWENDTTAQPDGIRISLDVYDRSRHVSSNPWDDPYVPTAGSLYTDVIVNALLDRLPASLPVEFVLIDDSPETTPTGLGTGDNADTDPMQTLGKWATNIGFDLSFDPLGRGQLRQTPDPINDEPAMTYKAGLHQVRVVRSREEAYNRIVVVGESPDAAHAVRSVVTDTDPTSPTYIAGIFGVQTFEYRSELIKTAAQATSTGEEYLRRMRGTSESVYATANPNPALDGWDILAIEHGPIAVNGAYALEAFPVPLAATEAAEYTTRKRREF